MTALLQTPLHELHVSLGARIVPFAGYAMPVQYKSGIIKEHTHTRSGAGLFDVSHMGQLRLTGADAAAALETLTPVDIVDLPDGRQRYALLTNDEGGVLDDFMAAKLAGNLYIVVNASRKHDDIAHLRSRIGGRCTIEVLDDRALLALQGPAAARVLARLAPETAALKFMSVAAVNLTGTECIVSRSGYTGEDGFEISVDAVRADALARELLSHDEVEPIGLGARDSLRLEAGLCLYGHDLDTTTTPVEAGLSWTVAKARRTGGARPGGYPGAAVIALELAGGAARRRVALLPRSRVPLRGGSMLHGPDGVDAGNVTSGGFGPTLDAPIAMGYVETTLARPGTMLSGIVRGKTMPVEVAKIPLVPHGHLCAVTTSAK
ncbi:glycine cleavage system aminomethyltransferase GcvT [Candidatus Rariloculus sp.]|uniref:glycine cleavage system aminomethyltransferase GcvT n=1 Tax=Candidatus Rariloculus sp. TaxID=3101265 RepID=UPI003D0B9249